ncbi:DUF5706 domain-containing protein [Streptomyces sp. DSM 44915]|uniref:DUF5706 domain-containing protein n=1 Tax=Streptomyces chisholmiae TaxID=3075540 RepID=A0ABU2JZ54_9ACTN|nr:Pycsar system effector family protein [Streptomyces sp. DSM 44915]MDT0270036.1 DUF5706 domain-containing protein [Streptomyces sp. DSM 44915]
MSQRDTNGALSEALSEVQGQIARTDAKAANLTTFLGLLLTGVTVGGGAMHLPVAAWLVGLAGVGFLLAAGVVLLWNVRPNTSPVPGTFPHWATLTADELRGELGTDHRPGAVTALSRLATAKYRRIRRAIDLTLCGGALLVVAAAIAAGGAL